MRFQVMPALSADDFSALKADIAERGVLVPIEYDDEGNILDGHHRVQICQELGIPEWPKLIRKGLTEAEKRTHARQLNLARRHLDQATRRALIEQELIQDPSRSNRQIAEGLQVDHKTVQAVRAESEGTGEIPQLDRTIGADGKSRPAKPIRTTFVDPSPEGNAEALATAKGIVAERAAQRKTETSLVAARRIAPPAGRYSCIVIDPPWQMEKIEREVRPNQVAFDYPTMSEDELAAFGVPEIAGDDCHLFCWTTQKFWPTAMNLVALWGFRYMLTMVWHKPGGFQPIGLPQYNCEFIVYARRGSPSFIDTKAFACCFEAPRREHSRKPNAFYDLIRRVTDGPRIDVFSREPRDCFDQYGNEVDKFAEAS